jgi:hypothetical protein
MGMFTAKHIIEEPSQTRRAFDVLISGGQLTAGVIGAKLSLSNIKEYVDSIRSREITYFKDTGLITSRNIYDVLGIKISSPFYRYGMMAKGIDFFNYGQPKSVVTEVPGLAQAPGWKPSWVSPDISVATRGSEIYVSPLEKGWQPSTGIMKPYIRTGYELGFMNPKPIVRPPPGALLYDEFLNVENPVMTDIKDFTTKFISPGWQPKTGIPFPIESKPVSIMDVVSGKPNPLDVAFKVKPAPEIVTKIGFDAEGNLVATKYGVKQKADVMWQPLTGTFEPPKRTGYELGFMNPKPVVKPTPGAIILYDPLVHAEDPFITELNKTLDMLSPNWQPKTGIPFPIERIAPIIKPVEVKPSPLDVLVRVKPASPVITKIGFDAEGKLVATKYGVTEKANIMWQPLTGTFEQPQRTGFDLWTTVFPKPTVYVPPGKLGFYEGIPLGMSSLLESGLPKNLEDIVHLKPASGKRLYTLRDIVKPVETKPTTGGQVQLGGTVTILEDPTTILDNIVMEEGEHIVDMYTESEVTSIEKANQMYEEIPGTIGRGIAGKRTGPSSIFTPFTGTRQEYSTIVGNISGSIQNQNVIQIQDIGRMTDSISNVMRITSFDTSQLMRQQSDQAQEFDQASLMVNPEQIVYDVKRGVIIINPPKETTEEIIVRKPPPKTLKGEIEQFKQIASSSWESPSFILGLRGRQWSHGERIGGSEYHPASKPLTFDDVMRLGVEITGKTEKASFILIPSEEKPTKPRKKLPDWTDKIMQFTRNKEGAWVELPAFRIDSPGEIRAITMKGIEAHRRHH